MLYLTKPISAHVSPPFSETQALDKANEIERARRAAEREAVRRARDAEARQRAEEEEALRAEFEREELARMDETKVQYAVRRVSIMNVENIPSW